MLKGLVAWWGRNPVAGNLLMLFCVLAGVFSFMKMEKEFWPAGRDDGVSIDACGSAPAPRTWKAKSSFASRKRPLTSTA